MFADKWWLLGGGPASSWPLPLSPRRPGRAEEAEAGGEACPLTRPSGCPFCVPQEIPRELTLDALLEMNEAKVKETLRRCGASAEECGRLQQALTCLRKVTGLGRWGLPPSPCFRPLHLPASLGLAGSQGLGALRRWAVGQGKRGSGFPGQCGKARVEVQEVMGLGHATCLPGSVGSGAHVMWPLST